MYAELYEILFRLKGIIHDTFVAIKQHEAHGGTIIHIIRWFSHFVQQFYTLCFLPFINLTLEFDSSFHKFFWDSFFRQKFPP